MNAERVKIDDRRQRVVKLYLQHKTQEQIAREIGVHQSTVSDDIAALREAWKAEGIFDFDAIKQREAAELDEMEAEAAVEFSKRKSTEWFRERLKCKERRAKLLGLDAPTKTDSNVNLNLTDAELVAATKAALAGDGSQGPDLSGDPADPEMGE